MKKQMVSYHLQKMLSIIHPTIVRMVEWNGMECIDEMIAIFGKTAVKHFCLLNVWKYRKKAVFKNGAEDMKKADWYMKKYVELGGKAVNC